MARDGSGSHNEPIFLGSGAPATASDLNEIVTFAASVGNVKYGSSTLRAELTGANVWDGLLFVELDLGGSVYARISGGWVPIYTPTVSGTITGAGAVSWANATLTKVGKRVFFEGRGTRGSDITTALVSGTLQAGFRPTTELHLPALSQTGGFAWSANGVHIQPDGTIYLNDLGVAGIRSVGFNATWLEP